MRVNGVSYNFIASQKYDGSAYRVEEQRRNFTTVFFPYLDPNDFNSVFLNERNSNGRTLPALSL